MQTGTTRIQSIDLLRGFAVVLMVMGHTVDSVLDYESRSTLWFSVYDFLRGFTAPTFLFVSGLAFTAATERRWQEYLTWTPALRKRVVRILLLLFIGYALHLPYFSFEKTFFGSTGAEIAGFLKTDILQCIAACLLILHLLILASGTPTVFSVVVWSLTGVIALSTPVVWALDLSPVVTRVVSPFFNTTQLSVFPIFPYAAFMFCGVATGHSFLRSVSRGETNRFLVTLGLTSALLAAAGVLLDLIPLSIYPVHDFWKTNPLFFMVRVSGVLQLTILFSNLRGIPDRIQSVLTTLGQSSLLIYAVHIVLVYGCAAAPGLFQRVGQTQPPFIALSAGVSVLLLMLALSRGWDYVRSNHETLSRFLQAGTAGAVVYLFLIRPY